MPKAFDDENEFASEPAKELAKLRAGERLRLILSGKYWTFALALVAGIASLASSLFFAVSPPPVRESPFVEVGRMISQDAEAITAAQYEIRRQLNSFPTNASSAQAKFAISEQLNAISRTVDRMRATVDAFNEPTVRKRSSIEIISSAHAQTSAKLTPDDVRLYGIIVILLVLGAAFLLCIGIILFSNHARRLTFAIDTTKVLMGFFVGVATSFFGVR